MMDGHGKKMKELGSVLDKWKVYFLCAGLIYGHSSQNFCVVLRI